jgi:membrane protease YdiL (CAAX protease family)
VSIVSEPAPQPSAPRDGLLPPQSVRWGIPDAVIGLGIFVAIIVGSSFLGRASWYPHSDALGTAIMVVFYAILTAYVVVVARRRGLGSLTRDFGLELRWVDLLIGVGLAIVLRFVTVVIYSIAIGVLRLPAAPTGNIDLPKNLVWAVIVGLGIASLIAPIIEELYFRGLLMRAIRNAVIRRSRFDGERTTARARTVSVVVSALIFAGFHLYEARNLTMLFVLGVDILIFGLIAAAIASRTRRLGPSMVMHNATNAFGTVILLSTYTR